MLEVAVAGGMAAVVVGGLLVQLSDAQRHATEEARRVTAQELASAVLSETRGQDYDAIASKSFERSVAGGTYSVGVAVTPNFDTVTMPSLAGFHVEPGEPRMRSRLSMNYKDIAVTVTWHARDGDKTESARSRAYRLTPVTAGGP